MANKFVTPTWVIREITRTLANSLKFAANVNRDYDGQYVKAGAKVGDTVKARLPQQYRAYKGAALQIQSSADRTVDITLTDQAHVGLSFSMQSLTLQVEDYKKRYLDRAVAALANCVDSDGCSRMYKKTYQYSGYPGTVPGSTGTLPVDCNKVYLTAGAIMTDMAVPTDGRVAVVSPTQATYLSLANQTLFNPAAALSESFKKGRFAGQALGISEWFEDQNIATHTTGPLGGTPVTNYATAFASGATSLVTNGWSNSTTVLKEGDVIEIASVYEVNPENYTSTGRLAKFSVQADVTSDGSGNATIYLDRAIINSGQYQNVDALPAHGAAITLFGHASSYANKASRQGLLFLPDAYTMVTADLEVPGGLWVAERISNKALGISVRFLKDYTITNDESPARVDVLYGWAAVRPDLALRLVA